MVTYEIGTIINAYLEGKAIQYKSGSEWIEFNGELKAKDFNHYVFRIKPEQKCRPYANAREFRAAQKEHGMYCVLTNLTEYTIDLPVQISDKNFYMSDVDFTYEDALKSLTWEDGSPCGVLTDNNE